MNQTRDPFTLWKPIPWNTPSPSCDVTAGTLNVGGGVLSYNSSGSAGSVIVTAGTLGGTSPVSITGPLTLGGGTVTSPLVTPSGLTSPNYAITFNAGTLTITAPAPVILSLTGAGTPNIVLTWSAVSNATYHVQFKSDLNVTDWTDLTGDVLASGSTASKTNAFTPANRFYRVLVVP